MITYMEATIQLICVSKVNTTWFFRGSGPVKNTIATVSYEISNLIMNTLTISYVTSQNHGKYECVHKRNKHVIIGDYVDVLVHVSPTEILIGKNSIMVYNVQDLTVNNIIN